MILKWQSLRQVTRMMICVILQNWIQKKFPSAPLLLPMVPLPLFLVLGSQQMQQCRCLPPQVIYETLAKFYGHCRVLGHVIASCTKAPKEGGLDQDLSSVPSTVAAVTRSKKGQSVAGKDQAADAAAKVVCLAPGSGMPPSNSTVESVGRVEFPSSSSDPMLAEVAAAKGGWVSVKKNKHSS